MKNQNDFMKNFDSLQNQIIKNKKLAKRWWRIDCKVKEHLMSSKLNSWKLLKRRESLLSNIHQMLRSLKKKKIKECVYLCINPGLHCSLWVSKDTKVENGLMNGEALFGFIQRVRKLKLMTLKPLKRCIRTFTRALENKGLNFQTDIQLQLYLVELILLIFSVMKNTKKKCQKYWESHHNLDIILLWEIHKL